MEFNEFKHSITAGLFTKCSESSEVRPLTGVKIGGLRAQTLNGIYWQMITAIVEVGLNFKL